jgi:hypothetical protein
MSTYTPTKLSDEALPTTSGTLYTAPGGVIVKEIVLANTNSSTVTATVSFDGLALVPAVTLTANSVTVLDLSKVMVNGDTLTGFASTAGVNCFVSGVVIS